jgi:hypothetical protein
MNVDYLKKFCAPADYFHEWMTKPLSIGNYSYATDGHIILRIPRDESIPENENALDCGKLFNVDYEPLGLEEVELPDIPITGLLFCCECNGKGTLRYRDEIIECEYCGGDGKYENVISVIIGGVFFSNILLLKIKDLPNIKFYPIYKDKTRFHRHISHSMAASV